MIGAVMNINSHERVILILNRKVKKVKIMKNVYDLVDIIKANNGNYEIKAIMSDGNVIDVGTQQYVEDGIYYMFRVQNDSTTTHTLDYLKSNLEYEASSECWRTDSWGIFDDGRSDLLDCEICFANYDIDEFSDRDYEDVEEYIFEINGITVDDEERIVYLHCEEFEDDISKVNSVDELTDDEKEMIKKALNYYGTRLADTEGYSSGEPYWDLMNRF